MTFNIYVPSYNRADTATTHKYLEYCTYVVRKSQYEDYKAGGIEDIISVEDTEIDNIVKVVNWILDNSEEDIIAMVDDDMDGFYYRLDKNTKVTSPEVATSEIERIAQLMADLRIGYGCVDATKSPWGYDGEFSFKGTSGGLRWFNKKATKARFSEEIGYCCDLDFVMQELLTNRIILKPKYFCSNGGTDLNKGGNSEKTRQSQYDSFEAMKNKWGRHFKYDKKQNKPYIMVRR